MSDRARGLVRDAVDRVPDRPGDLDAVRARAGQRRARQRTMAVTAAALVLVAAVVSIVAERPVVRAPVVGSEAAHAFLLVRWCPPTICDEPPMAPDEARTLLAADPAVRSTQLIDAETVRVEVEQHQPPDAGTLPPEAFAPIIEVEVDRDDEPLLDIARRLHETVPGVTIEAGRFRDRPQFPAVGVHRSNGYEPDAALGERVRVLAGPPGGLDVWTVTGGGVCFGLDGLTSCHANVLLTRTDVSQWHGAFGQPDDRWTCSWGATGLETDEVLVTFQDGTTTRAELGSAPDLLLGQAYLACTDADTFPVRIETSAPGSSQAVATDDEDPPRSVVDRVD